MILVIPVPIHLKKIISLGYESGTVTNARNPVVRKIQGDLGSPGSSIPL